MSPRESPSSKKFFCGPDFFARCVCRVFIFLVTFSWEISYAQEPVFNKVLPPAGKPFKHVTGIVQDRDGYMWLATKKWVV